MNAEQAAITKRHQTNTCANVTTRYPNGAARSCTCANEYAAAAVIRCQFQDSIRDEYAAACDDALPGVQPYIDITCDEPAVVSVVVADEQWADSETTTERLCATHYAQLRDDIATSQLLGCTVEHVEPIDPDDITDDDIELARAATFALFASQR